MEYHFDHGGFTCWLEAIFPKMVIWQVHPFNMYNNEKLLTVLYPERPDWRCDQFWHLFQCMEWSKTKTSSFSCISTSSLVNHDFFLISQLQGIQSKLIFFYFFLNIFSPWFFRGTGIAKTKLLEKFFNKALTAARCRASSDRTVRDDPRSHLFPTNVICTDSFPYSRICASQLWKNSFSQGN